MSRASVLLVFLLASALVPLQAQDRVQDRDEAFDGYVILQRQPQVSRGVPVLPANTLRYLRSTYDYGGTLLEVYLVPGAEPPRDERSWELAACPAVTLEYLTDEHLPLWRVPREGYLLYVTLPAGDAGNTVASGGLCAFAGSFVEVFEFFLAESPRRLETLRPPPEFPAVLQVPR